MKDTRVRYDNENWCVYKHTSPSGKCYIGITSAKNPNLRWGVGGRRYLYKHETRGEHVKFVNAINKYGWDNIKHEILETGLTHKEAKEKEKYYIELKIATKRHTGIVFVIVEMKKILLQGIYQEEALIVVVA